MEWLNQLSITILVAISSWMQQHDLPLNPIFSSPRWQVTQEWGLQNNVYSMAAVSKDVGPECSGRTGYSIRLPTINYGAHEVFADGKLVMRSGDPALRTYSSLATTHLVPCSLLEDAALVEWRAYSYARSTARIREFPDLIGAKDLFESLRLALQVLGAGLLIFSFMVSLSQIRHLKFVPASALVFAYLGFICHAFIHLMPIIDIDPPLQVGHKLWSVTLVTGTLFLLMFVAGQYSLNKTAKRIAMRFLFVALLISAVALTGDTIQLASMLALATATGALTVAAFHSIKRSIYGRPPRPPRLLKSTGVLLFASAYAIETMMTLGMIGYAPIMPIQIAMAFTMFALGINESARQALLERIRSNQDHQTMHPREASQSAPGPISEMQSIDLAEIIHSVVELVKPHLKAQIRIQAQATAQLHLQCSPSSIIQILLSLVTNAADAITDSGKIEIAARKQGENAVVRVSDTGRGIPKEILGRVFDPFFSTKSTSEVSGLGLYVVKRDIERLGGTVKISSHPDQGTEVTLILPLSNNQPLRHVA
jgi:signal transduction histidine kinase